MECNFMNNNLNKNWNLINTEPGPDLIIFKARYDTLENPRTGRKMKAVVLDVTDWVNVVAMTPEGQFVVVHQYRFGIGKTTVEIPAGMVDPGEEHQTAARRELREETGYTTDDWVYLGYVEPNPAFQNNHCHQWLAKNVQKTHPIALDGNEDIAVTLMSISELQAEVKSGRLRHSLALLALSQVIDLWGNRDLKLINHQG